jgi:hypothetical protein
MRETLKTPPEMAQSLTRKCEKGGREEDTSTCVCGIRSFGGVGFGVRSGWSAGQGPILRTHTHTTMRCCVGGGHGTVDVITHIHTTYRKGREVIDEEDPGQDRGAVVVRVGVPLQPRGPFPVQGLEALRHREAVRADGLACVVVVDVWWVVGWCRWIGCGVLLGVEYQADD